MSLLYLNLKQLQQNTNPRGRRGPKGSRIQPCSTPSFLLASLFLTPHSTAALVVFKNLYDLMTVDFYICVNICESNTECIDKGIISLAFIHT